MLLCPLVDPGAYEADLFGRQRLGRVATAATATTESTLPTTGATLSTAPSVAPAAPTARLAAAPSPTASSATCATAAARATLPTSEVGLRQRRSETGLELVFSQRPALVGVPLVEPLAEGGGKFRL